MTQLFLSHLHPSFISHYLPYLICFPQASNLLISHALHSFIRLTMISSSRTLPPFLPHPFSFNPSLICPSFSPLLLSLLPFISSILLKPSSFPFLPFYSCLSITPSLISYLLYLSICPLISFPPFITLLPLSPPQPSFPFVSIIFSSSALFSLSPCLETGCFFLPPLDFSSSENLSLPLSNQVRNVKEDAAISKQKQV